VASAAWRDVRFRTGHLRGRSAWRTASRSTDFAARVSQAGGVNASCRQNPVNLKLVLWEFAVGDLAVANR
jgi:hypothetical protein